MASLASAPPAAAQSGSAEPGLLSHASSWLAGQVAGWFAEEPKGEIRPAQAPITLPGRDGTPAQLKLDPVKEPGKRVKELTGQRTAVSKAFELEDGRRQVEISAVRQHVRVCTVTGSGPLSVVTERDSSCRYMAISPCCV
ncbi:hypothetical protein ACWDRB_66425, partial [Nonomuraea sp. NPDC003707]